MGSTATLMIALGAMTTTGCDRKTSQCNRLIGVINAEQKPLEDIQNNNPDELKKLADTLDAVAEKVRGVELKDSSLVGFRDDYATMAADLAATSRETAEALASNDPAKAGEAAKKMNSFNPRETKLVDEINAYCTGSP